MEKLCFAIQGKTFLKSMMPLIIFSNKLGIQPVIFCFAKRMGKPYDNIDVAYLTKVLADFKVFCELVMVDNNQEINQYELNNLIINRLVTVEKNIEELSKDIHHLNQSVEHKSDSYSQYDNN